MGCGTINLRPTSVHHLFHKDQNHLSHPNPVLFSYGQSSMMNSHVPVIVHTEIMTPTVTIDSAHDPNTGTWQYIVTDPYSMSGIIIDSVLDFDDATRTIGTHTADRLVSLVRAKGYHITRVLETHTHSDHLSASSYIQTILERDQHYRPLTCIGKRVQQVREMMGETFGVPANVLGCAFDELLDDDETFHIGCLKATVLHLPGHTLDHVGYMIEGIHLPTTLECRVCSIALINIADNVFCGDILLNADLNIPRCEYPSGNPKELYRSTRRLLDMPNHYRLWIGHDYTNRTRRCPIPYLSVGEQKQRHYHPHEITLEQVL